MLYIHPVQLLCQIWLHLVKTIKQKVVSYILLCFRYVLVCPGTDKEGRIVCFERAGRDLIPGVRGGGAPGHFFSSQTAVGASL